MPSLISSDTCENAYILASQHLITQSKTVDHNLIISISNPCDFTRLPYCLRNRNPKKLHKNFDNLRHVINTIFPYGLSKYFEGNRNNFYQTYLKIYSSGKNRSWGTYFQRFISFSKHNSTGKNQLENIINSLNGGSKQKYYNIMHTTSVNLESNVRPMGGACLQYIQFNKSDVNSLNMIAIYRNHDYFNKALGNFYGLAHLLNHIVSNTNYTAGSLTIHSIHAFSSQGKNKLNSLII